MLILLTVLEAFLLASALSMDSFVSGFAYGIRKIRIPFLSVVTVSAVCSSILGLSLLAGAALRPYLPVWATTAVCFTMMFFLGLVKLLDSVTKSIIRKYSGINKQINFSLFNIQFMLSLYANPEAADTDHSLCLSPAEAVSLAVALSLDGMAVGFGAALADGNGWAVFVCSLVTGTLFLTLGEYTGHKLARTLSFNISWVSGVILLVLAFFKLI